MLTLFDLLNLPLMLKSQLDNILQAFTMWAHRHDTMITLKNLNAQLCEKVTRNIAIRRPPAAFSHYSSREVFT